MLHSHTVKKHNQIHY